MIVSFCKHFGRPQCLLMGNRFDHKILSSDMRLSTQLTHSRTLERMVAKVKGTVMIFTL